MGKGNRNSQKVDKAVKRNNNKQKGSGKAIAAACIVFAVIIVAVLLINLLNETGVLAMVTPAMSLNNVKVDVAMMNFFYNDYLASWYNSYGNYSSLLQIDFSVSLKLQQFPMSIAPYILGESYNGTWYGYFRDKVTQNVDMYITFCDAANAAGIKLTEAEIAEVNADAQLVFDEVKKSGATLKDWFGKGVNEDVVRRCYLIMALANKYSEHKYEALKTGLESEIANDNAPIMEYVNSHKENFYTAEYLAYEIKVSESGYTEEEYANAVKDAKAQAEAISKAGSVETFLELINQYEASQKQDQETETKDETTTESGDETESGSGDETESGTETTDIEKLADKYRETIAYDTVTDTATTPAAQERNWLENWIFIKNATKGEGGVFSYEDTEKVTTKKEETTEATEETTEAGSAEATTEGTTETETKKETSSGSSSSTDKKTSKYTVVTAYLLTKTPYLDTALTSNIAFVIGDKKADVDALREKFASSSEKTIDSFIDMAEAYAESLHASHDHSAADFVEPVFIYNEGEQVAPNFFNNNYFGKVNLVDDWLDTELEDGSLSKVYSVTVEKQTYYVTVFFQGRGKEVYHVNAFNSIISERFDYWYENESGKKNINYSQFGLNSLDPVKLG
ncbi:MAG: hypothetical protein E7649_07505 [Ruminococcaceae bacterium]|nr:hypothetical protein [Oscillospiraceae bacterium]